MRNLDIATKLIRKGSVLLIPDVRFSGGVIKSKYCVALEDGDAFWRKGRCILACFTTSRVPIKLRPWQVPVAPSYKILGESQTDTTYIDCRNRVFLIEQQIKRCKFVGQLPDEVWVLVSNAKEIADIYESSS